MIDELKEIIAELLISCNSPRKLKKIICILKGGN